MKNKQLDLWSGSFGEEYSRRNIEYNFDSKRLLRMKEIFKKMLSYTHDITRILEVGCNSGHNFSAIQQLGKFELVGIDPQASALRKGKEHGITTTLIHGNVFNIPFFDDYFDLTFATGVMMHISPNKITHALNEIKRVTQKYFFTMDYYEENEVAVKNYHSLDDMLWRRDMNTYMSKVSNTKLIWEEVISFNQINNEATKAYLFEFSDK